MGLVWEAYHKGVPFLGVPENHNFSRPDSGPTPSSRLGPKQGKISDVVGSTHPQKINMTILEKQPLSSWWLNHPSEKYDRQIGSFPQVRVKIKNL